MSTALYGLQSAHSYKVSFKAEAAVTKYAAVIAGTAADEVDMPAAANDEAVGITTEAAAIDGNVEVICHGPAIAIASAACARGALLAVAGTSGKLAPITIGTTTADARVVARALSAAGADGDQIAVWVLQNPAVLV